MDRNNVVSIRAGKGADNIPSGHKQLIDRSQELFCKRTIPAVTAVLERVDDVLFELADKATSTTEQTIYFDAMREVRLKRDSIKSEFTHQLHALFTDSLEGRVPSNEEQSDPYDLEKLSLIEDEDLEESLAVTNAVSKINSDCRETLFALDRRMGHLLNDPELHAHINPLGPENICKAFRTACSTLESSIEIRLIIFKLFEKHVTGTLYEAYQEANEYLIEQGILPEIRSTIRKSPGKAHHEDGTALSGDDNNDDAGLFAALQKLLGIQMQAAAPINASPGGSGMAFPGQGNAVAATAIVSDLTRLQQQDATITGGDGSAVDLMQFGTRNVVQELRDSGAFNSASQADSQTIDIVSMMFDYILGDDAIPVVIKAQIGRLQIPVLKAALLDQSLFSKRTHPVRQLLDTIAHAGIGWEDWETDILDELTGQIEAAVQRILLEFEDNIELFAEVLSEFQTYLDEKEQEYSGRHDRIAKVLKGREQVETAKRRIKDQFADRIIDNPVPDFVTEFLLRNWSEVLLKVYIHDGEDSPAWINGIGLVDNLIWSLTPKTTKEDRRKLIELLPRLLIELKAGMKKSGMDEHTRKRFLDQLADCHANAVKPVSAKTAANAPASTDAVTRAVPVLDEKANQPDDDGRTLESQKADITDSPFLKPDLMQDHNIDENEIPTQPAESSAAGGIQSETELEDCIENYFRESEEVMRMLSTNELEVEEIELYEEESQAAELDDMSDTNSPADTHDEYLRQVFSMNPGDWLETKGPEGKLLKVKLCSPDFNEIGVLSFIDRRGKTVIRKSADGLAAELRTGQARILDDAPLFERAIKSVVHKIQNIR